MQANLKICFLILVGNRFYSENEIGARLIEMVQATAEGKIDIITISGAISINFNNEELLGVEFWDSVNMIFATPHSLLNGNSRHQCLPYQSCWLRVHPQPTRLLYELESVASSRIHHVKRSLPLHDFLREWVLMVFRLTKFEAYLGSKRAEEVLNNWQDKMPITEQLCQIVGIQNIEHIINNKLEDVLLNSNCSQGFEYSAEKGFYVAI